MQSLRTYASLDSLRFIKRFVQMRIIRTSICLTPINRKFTSDAKFESDETQSASRDLFDSFWEKK